MSSLVESDLLYIGVSPAIVLLEVIDSLQDGVSQISLADFLSSPIAAIYGSYIDKVYTRDIFKRD